MCVILIDEINVGVLQSGAGGWGGWWGGGGMEGREGGACHTHGQARGSQGTSFSSFCCVFHNCLCTHTYIVCVHPGVHVCNSLVFLCLHCYNVKTAPVYMYVGILFSS